MRRFNVKVNGRLYEVEVEELVNGLQAAAPQQAVQAQAQPTPVVQAQPAQTAPAAAAALPQGTQVPSPLPGVITQVKVQAGDTVKSGQVILVIEAMKMENDILSPCDGTIKALNVTKGSNVNTGAVLAVIG